MPPETRYQPCTIIQHISTSCWTHAGLRRSIKEAVVPENKTGFKKSILINPIVLVPRETKLHIRKSRIDIQDFFKLTCQPLVTLLITRNLHLAEDWARPQHGSVSRPRPTFGDEARTPSVGPMTSIDLR